MVSAKDLSAVAATLRRDVLEMTTAAGSGHASSSLSCAEIMTALFFSEMQYEVKNANNLDNDEFILSKGHAAPILYASLFRAGCIHDNLNTLRKIDSRLEGHPVPASLPWVKVATGSLGQGLSVGVGMSLAGQLQKKKFRTFVLLGDSECAEGSVWEAAELASYYKLSNLVAIVDVNHLGQRGETMLAYDLKTYKERFESFGWQALIVNGHSIPDLQKALKKARQSKLPTVILAKTVKGKGVSFIENKDGWHGKALSKDELVRALKQIPKAVMPHIKIPIPAKSSQSHTSSTPKFKSYKLGEEVATREAYGDTLASIAQADSLVVALDGEVSNSTYADKVKKTTQKQFIESFIAEQNMIGMALGLEAKGHTVFASSFGAFLTRAHDQLRMAALSESEITVCGSHAGVSIGEDGASQMALDDIAMFRAMPNSTIFYPSDAVSTQKLMQEGIKRNGLTYIRTTRARTPVLYRANEEFPLGDFKTLRESDQDKAVIVGAGITLHEALKAYAMLKTENIPVAVVDLYCIKPLDKTKLAAFIKSHGARVVVVEDHYPEGGIGETLATLCRNTQIFIESLAVRHVPHSGTKDELLAEHGIDALAITKAVKRIYK